MTVVVSFSPQPKRELVTAWQAGKSIFGVKVVGMEHNEK